MRSPNLLLTSYPDRSFPIHPSGFIRFAFRHPSRSGLLDESLARSKTLELLSVLEGSLPSDPGPESAAAIIERRSRYFDRPKPGSSAPGTGHFWPLIHAIAVSCMG